MTRHTQAERVNLARMRANAIEAAEQCGILNVPEIAEPVTLDAFVRGWVPERVLVFCDEDAEVKDPVAALSAARGGGIAGPSPVSVLVGPEGGFAEEERAALLKLAERRAARARAPHPARRYRRRRGTGAGSGGARRLALAAAYPLGGTKQPLRRFSSPMPTGESAKAGPFAPHCGRISRSF